MVSKLTPAGSTKPRCGDGLTKDQAMPIIRHKQNTKATLSINGNSGHVSLNNSESKADANAESNAAVAVVRDQNKPRAKIATIPGVKNPGNS